MRIDGKLALMLDGSRAVFDRGAAQGVRVGQAVAIYAETVVIRDPDTGEHLGDYEPQLGTLVVEEVRPRISVCRVIDREPRNDVMPVRIAMPMRTLD